MENKFYGTGSPQLQETNGFDLQLEEIKVQGFTVVEDLMNDEDLAKASKKLDATYKDQVQCFGEENLVKIKEKNLVRSPLLYDDFFLSMVLHPAIINIVKYFLGDYFIINQQNGIINMPNEAHHQSAWHRDLPYQNYVISKPIAIAALYCIDDFTEERGSTYVIPFSHQLTDIPSNSYLDKFKAPVNAKKGSVIIFNAMVYHRAGYNSSQFVRRGLNTLFSIPLIIQQINLSRQLNGKFSEDPFLRRLLGYDIQIPDTVEEWRQNRLKK